MTLTSIDVGNDAAGVGTPQAPIVPVATETINSKAYQLVQGADGAGNACPIGLTFVSEQSVLDRVVDVGNNWKGAGSEVSSVTYPFTDGYGYSSIVISLKTTTTGVTLWLDFDDTGTVGTGDPVHKILAFNVGQTLSNYSRRIVIPLYYRYFRLRLTTSIYDTINVQTYLSRELASSVDIDVISNGQYLATEGTTATIQQYTYQLTPEGARFSNVESAGKVTPATINAAGASGTNLINYPSNGIFVGVNIFNELTSDCEISFDGGSTWVILRPNFSPSIDFMANVSTIYASAIKVRKPGGTTTVTGTYITGWGVV